MSRRRTARRAPGDGPRASASPHSSLAGATISQRSARSRPTRIRSSVSACSDPVRDKDGFAQQKLLEGLKDPDKALVPPEKALQLLSYDVHAEAYPVAREIVNKPPNEGQARSASAAGGRCQGRAALRENSARQEGLPDPADRGLGVACPGPRRVAGDARDRARPVGPR